jgi:hypothetical protein
MKSKKKFSKKFLFISVIVLLVAVIALSILLGLYAHKYKQAESEYAILAAEYREGWGIANEFWRTNNVCAPTVVESTCDISNLVASGRVYIKNNLGRRANFSVEISPPPKIEISYDQGNNPFDPGLVGIISFNATHFSEGGMFNGTVKVFADGEEYANTTLSVWIDNRRGPGYGANACRGP